ncbi:peptidase S9 [Thalassotalea insulae]|uniref:Peptidase S9 n=1 Tax=Thalassotalea insulae TaxID=2056778 RepID=A0ABQ6GUG8_9GAMM|nr:DPP IV N-terminal domain-containing protein [Thalassotalea insulae]GLX78997.1 peptidase S9 [Thalassotalea insulae]
MQLSTMQRWLVGAVITTTVIACQSTTTTKQTQVKQATKNPLTLERIYKDREFSSDHIGRIRWLKDGSGYTALEDSAETKNEQGKAVSIGKDIVVYAPDTLKRTILVNAQQLIPQGQSEPLKIDDYSWSADRQKLMIYTNSKKVWRSKSRGDYWVLELNSGKLSRLGGKDVKDSSLMFAKFSPDASRVAYVVENNIYLENLASQKITQLTDSAGNGIINGLFDWVYEEEFGIRDGFRWSPDGKKIAYWQLDTSGSKDFHMINNTDSLYPKITTFPYPKVGETNALAKIGIVDLATSKTTWAKIPNNSRDMYIPRMNWTGNSDEILVQHLNRKQDHNILYLTNVATGKVNEIYTELDENFLDGIKDAKWINDGKHFIWTSETSGWRHFYSISRDGKTKLDLTPGHFDVISIEAVDEKNGWLYYIASPKNVSQRYLFRSKLDASEVNQQMTPERFAGSNSYHMSPDGQWAIHTHSTFTQPAQKRLIKVENHQEQHMMMDNKALIEKLTQLTPAQHEFFQVTAQDGIVLDGYIMRPADFDPKKKYPIIFYVYGEAWGQTVQDKWRGNSYLWDQMLTEKGYLVASIDNRGTRAPKGRKWRKEVYGAIGVLSSRDQSDALNAMAERWNYIDTNRVGIWGHSGGGSMTLNMLFRYPEQYHVGVSLAPVPDQRLYDTIYQERYSGILADNEEGYKLGSPITHAKNLKGNLLLVHGTGDDNVHYQGSERLINELVKYNKQFQFMSYPNRSHGLWEGEGTTLHLQTMKTNYFDRYLMNRH